MKTSFAILYPLILISIVEVTLGYTYQGETSTDDACLMSNKSVQERSMLRSCSLCSLPCFDDGHCHLESDGFETIKIGESAYNDTKCEKVTCKNFSFEVFGCGVGTTDRDDCRLVRRPGRYPDCCETTLECDNDEQQKK